MFSTFDTNGMIINKYKKIGVNKNGVGLGLVMCQKLVSLLGPSNKLKVKSKIGLGSKFSFLIYSNIELSSEMNFQEQRIESKNRYIAVK